MFPSIIQNDDTESVMKLTAFSVHALDTVWDLIKEDVEKKRCAEGVVKVKHVPKTNFFCYLCT